MKEYFSVVPHGPRGPFSAPPMAREPDAGEIMARACTEGEWLVPVEMVLKCSTSAYVGLVRVRHARGEMVSRTARVIQRGNRFFATVYFRDKSDLFMALDCWSFDEGDER